MPEFSVYGRLIEAVFFRLFWTFIASSDLFRSRSTPVRRFDLDAYPEESGITVKHWENASHNQTPRNKQGQDNRFD